MPLARDRVRGAFAGLRPLVDTGAAETADVSRRHLVRTSESGVVSVLGGKLTTYRRMAEDAVDLAVRQRGLRVGPSGTATLRLIDDPAPDNGSQDAVADGIALSRPVVEHAVRSQGALTAADVLDRRTRIGLVPDERARALPAVERIVAETLVDIPDRRKPAPGNVRQWRSWSGSSIAPVSPAWRAFGMRVPSTCATTS